MSNPSSDKNKKTLASFLKLSGKFSTVPRARAYVDSLPQNAEILQLMNSARKSGTSEQTAHGIKSTRHGAIARAVSTSQNEVLASLRAKLIALFGEQQARQEDLDVQRPAPSQFEMNPVEQLQTINRDPADEGGRPDQLPPPPPNGEEKQPDSATSVPQPLGVGFQNLGIPEDTIRQQRQRQIERALPGASPDVVQNMVNNTDDGILAGQREDTANDIYEEEKSEIGPGVRGQASGFAPPQPSQTNVSQFLSQLSSGRNLPRGRSRVPITNENRPQQRTASATKHVNDSLAEEVKAGTTQQSRADEVNEIWNDVRTLEQKYPEFQGRIGYVAASIVHHLRDAPSNVMSAVPWLAYTLIAYQANRAINPTPLKGSPNYGAISTLIGTLATMGMTAPQGIKDWVSQKLGSSDKAEARADEDPDADADDGNVGGQNNQDVPDPGIQGDAPDAAAGFRERFGIPIQDMPADQRVNLVGRVQAALGGGVAAGVVNQIIDYARGRLKLDPSSEAAVKIMKRLQRMMKEETEEDKEKPRKEKTGRSREIQEEPIELKYEDTADPKVGDLRPSFKILGTDEDTETSQQAIMEQFKFANYRHVEEGHGNGANNQLYLQNKAWDNMVRFVNNFVPAVDRLSKLEECSLQSRPSNMPLKAVVGAKKINRKFPNGDPDLLLKNAYIQPAVARPDNLFTFNLENPNIPFSNVNPPTTDFAEFKQTNNRLYPVGGTVRPSMPRTTYSNPRSAAGLKFPTGRYDTQSSLELRPAPPLVVPREMEKIPWTSVSTVERSKPQDPFMSDFGGTINNPWQSVPPSFKSLRKKY